MNVGPIKSTAKLVTPKQIIKTGGNITFRPEDKFYPAKVGGSSTPASKTQNTAQSFFAKLSEKFQSMPLA